MNKKTTYNISVIYNENGKDLNTILKNYILDLINKD